MTTDAADITDVENFGIAHEQHVTVSIAALDTTKTAPGWIHSKAIKPVDAETLAKRWLIPASHAARTVDRTTQQGVCTMLNPTLIACCIALVCLTLFLATQCLLGQNQKKATSVARSLPPIIAPSIAALNGHAVKAADILNAYISAPIKEIVWCALGPEFGPDAGKPAIIVRALYGLKSPGAAFYAHLADCMQHHGYTSSPANPDLWYKEVMQPVTGVLYYSYILIYVDDILCIHHDAMPVLDKHDK
jgi:hypothetical protein